MEFVITVICGVTISYALQHHRDFREVGKALCMASNGIIVAGTSFIAFHFMAMTKTNKFNGGDFLQVCTSLWEC